MRPPSPPSSRPASASNPTGTPPPSWTAHKASAAGGGGDADRCSRGSSSKSPTWGGCAVVEGRAGTQTGPLTRRWSSTRRLEHQQVQAPDDRGGGRLGRRGPLQGLQTPAELRVGQQPEQAVSPDTGEHEPP